eukprot:Gb_00228 [translate_table: standard]
MEAEIGLDRSEGQVLQEQQQFYPSKGYDFMLKGKQVMESDEHRHEWDLNDWEWDSNLFIARPLNDDTEPGFKEKRRKMVVVEEDDLTEEAACLTLKLGGSEYSGAETDVANGGTKNGKRSRLQPTSAHHPICQVDDCKADLNNAKDYHRRHKVCEMHSKATKALVGRYMQRFCQQCSRFHLLQEFDEGKRSCRRRLAGHNRRRRKTHPDAIVSGACLNDERTNGSLFISLLRVLSQLQTPSNSDQASDRDLLFQLLKKVASSAGILESNALAAKQSSDQHNSKTSLCASSEGISQPLQKNFLTCNAALEIRKPHNSFRPEIAQCTMPNSSTIGSSCRAGILDRHCHVFERTTDHPTSGCAQPLVSAQKQHSVIVPEDSVHSIFKSDAPHHSNNFWQIREGFQQQNEFREPMPQLLRAQSTVERRNTVSNNFDLNSVDNAPQEFIRRSDEPSTLMLLGGLDGKSRQDTALCHSWAVSGIGQTSPLQASDNSESGSDQSPTSSQDGQDRTGRIVFKLFGKDPSGFPQVLRSQILDWLAHSPSDIESYIRPGCVILTIYLRLSESLWEELGRGLRNGLERLLEASDSDFWKTGWIYAQVGHQIAFIYNGQVLLDTPSSISNAPKLLSVTPIAVTAGKKTNIVVKGLGLSSSSTKILCAFQGKHSVQEALSEQIQEDGSAYLDGSDHFESHRQIHCRSFCWFPSDSIGRCFIEVEGYDLRGSFFPVIVAEQDVCAEIRTLEKYIEMPSISSHYEATQNCAAQVKVKKEAIEFLHELGWLFQRSCLIHRPNFGVLYVNTFSRARYKWLLEYATERDWCAVVRKLLNILFNSNTKGTDYSAVTILDEVGPLHRAVRRNCRTMVEFLLAYVPELVTENTNAIPGQERKKPSGIDNFVLKPDMVGPAGLTPLHIAASMEGAEGVVDALTSDPSQIGARAWNSVRDQTGMTPEDYALLGGHHAYIELVQKKLVKNKISGHVSLDMHELLSQEQNSLKQLVSGPYSSSQGGLDGKSKVLGNKVDIELSQKIGQYGDFQSDHCKIRTLPSHCELCDRQLLRKHRPNNLLYRPAMLSMVAIATVCVCVALLLKGPPHVLFVMPPFRWEVVDFGFQ